jgi:phospholipid/cholesterol/gamma-HCH transport system permease protein
MIKTHTTATFIYNDRQQCYECQGTWAITNLDDLRTTLNQTSIPNDDKVIINGVGLDYFDSSAALALRDFSKRLQEKNKEVIYTNFSKQQQALLNLINEKNDYINYQIPTPEKNSIVYRIGEEATYKAHQATGFIKLIGDLASCMRDAVIHWRRFRLPSMVSNINSTGVQALPIVALLSFLIGVVLAYQMGLQLQTYGASIFIAYLSGMAIFREFAPLITAIIVAGRTSSAFTAQLGSMKINEEIDALKTMGLSQTELLVMPKVIGLLIVFPLLIFWADCFSILGAMVMAKSMLNVGYFDFLARLKESVGIGQFLLGLYKAPAFALLVALVGCFQGFLVKANADSLGSQTTKSVVQALFLIIVADAMFSIFYSWMGL